MTNHALEYLSHSRLDSYRTCSLKFRYNYIDKPAPAFTPAPLAFGIAFHRAVEEALVGLMVGAFPAVGELVQVFTRTLDEQGAATPIRFGEKESRETMIDQATRMLEAWTTWPRPPARVLAVEHEIRVSMAEWLPPLVGRVDLVEEGDVVTVLDVKTSRARWSEEDVLQHASQLALYRAGVADLVRDIGKPVRVGFEIITKTKNPVVERLYLPDGGETLERQVKTATLVLEAVERGIYIPSPGWQCASCPYRDACRAW